MAPVGRSIISRRGQVHRTGRCRLSKPTETRVCRISRQSRYHHEVFFRPCSILGRSPGARCHAHSGLSTLLSASLYYVDRVGLNIVAAIRNREVHGRYSECFIVLRQWSSNRDRALVVALARCPLLGMSVKRGSTVAPCSARQLTSVFCY